MLDKISATKEIIVCAYDGYYHYGAGALANSLVKAHFKGVIYIAYRNVLPPWKDQLKPINDTTYILTEDIIILFQSVETDMHLAYYKPYLIKQAFNKFPQSEKFYYFDVDIIITAPWSFFSRWLEEEVCLCLDDSFAFVHPNHPWRKEWRKLANAPQSGINSLSYYVNSGFIGVSRANISLVDTWIQITNSFINYGGSVTEFTQEGHNSYKGDQDLLNATLTISPQIPLSLIGKEGMGFEDPAYLMTHAIAKKKPWNKNYITSLLRVGHKPTHSEKNFFNNCRHPIKMYSTTQYRLKRINLAIAQFLGRYIGY